MPPEANQVKDAFIDLSAHAMKLFGGLRDAEGRGMEVVLDRLGLQRRQSALTPALWFAAGAVLAGTTVLLWAPASGKKLREALATFLAGTDVGAKATSLEHRVEEAVKSDVAPLKRTPNGAEHAQ